MRNLVTIAAATTALLLGAGPAEACRARPRPPYPIGAASLPQLTDRIGLVGTQADLFDAYWRGHGGPRIWSLREHPWASVDPAVCYPAGGYVFGTLCYLAVNALDAAGVSDPWRPATFVATAAARYDFPARAVRDDFPRGTLLAYQRRFDPSFPLTGVLQCGVFALWRTDDNMRAGLYAMQRRLNTAGKHEYPHGIPSSFIDNAARRLGYGVDHTPSIGAIAVLENGYHGASRTTGHSFYVARVDAVHHTLRLEEYNGTRSHAYSTRVVAWSYASEYVHFHG